MLLFHGSGGQALDDVTLEYQDKDHGKYDRQHRGRRYLPVFYRMIRDELSQCQGTDFQRRIIKNN